MQYRKFGNTGVEVSALGFGCMRFPVNEDKTINEEKAIAMVRHAIDNGVNYVDTAYPYHQGTSELVVGKALKDGYREKVYLADKMPVWLLETEDDFDKYLDEQLKKLDTDHIDFYLLHALSRERYEEKVKKLNLTKKLEEAKAAGKIRYIGFSFHDSLDLFKEIIDSYDGWDFCQIQYNYMDEVSQAGRAGLQAAAQRGLPVIIMESLRGGKLVNLLPENARKLFEKNERGWGPAEWALRWLWDQPEVTCVLSGMNSLEMVEENCRIADSVRPHTLSEADFALLEQVKAEITRQVKAPCTGCGYCMPCPKGVDIPGAFRCYNEMFTENKRTGRREYWQVVSLRREPAFATQCVGCGRCEQHCPQHLPIRELLKDADKALRPWHYRLAGWVSRKYLFSKAKRKDR